jgi:hypothetical protein
MDKSKRRNLPGLVAVEADTVTASTASHRLAGLGTIGLAMPTILLAVHGTLRSGWTYPGMPQLKQALPPPPPPDGQSRF